MDGIGVKTRMTQAPYQLRNQAGDEEYAEGETLFDRGGVRLTEQSPAELRYVVAGTPRREVIFTPDEPARCTCDAYLKSGACRHVVAATLMAQSTGALDDMFRRKAAAAAPRLMSAMESALPEDGTLRMEITLICETGKPKEKPRLKIGLRVGEERLYVVRSIPQLIEAVDSRTSIEFGKGFLYQPEWMHFAPGRCGYCRSCAPCAWLRRRAAWLSGVRICG